MARSLPASTATKAAARLLGQQVRAGRLQRRWTLEGLAERIGVSDTTVRKVERGDLSVALGTALEAATLVGVELHGGAARQAQEERRLTETLALLPAAARPIRQVGEDF
jgi:transcriptional regulator with XRE-family HTH domain